MAKPFLWPLNKNKQYISARELGPTRHFVSTSDRQTTSVWIEKELL